ncbi:hypothetical protein IV203_025719 [Nitzschia inconspicua]|uniref:Uncharacterized protein n=1 Tax=Nitzschia inconspicua TaxID=303405 RepID=A0A9K3PWB2_9STRA|nr:hypothetical protein IV203_025719 [Nitzschia inconspicua]
MSSSFSSSSSMTSPPDENNNKNQNMVAAVPRMKSFGSGSPLTSSAATFPLPTVTPAATKNRKNDNSADATATTTVARSPSFGGPLLKSVRKALQKQTLNFKINVECTSLRLSPSGNFLWGGFSDGTLRVFDLSGTFDLQRPNKNKNDTATNNKSGRPFLNSKHHQSYGAVACQIHARGVHTDLITTVDIAPDGKFVFCGVSRGAMELYAVNVEALEEAVLTQRRLKQKQINNAKQQQNQQNDDDASQENQKSLNILDYIQVFCHSDAKLKGFGACTSMMVKGDGKGGASSQSYLLLTGKGIKNIHIWKFSPPHATKYHAIQTGSEEKMDVEDNGAWEQLYDTSTNGNTIVLLNFYRTPNGKLMAVSKSDVQKLRLWDLSLEEQDLPIVKRPKRPPYQDVDNSHAALGIAGGFCVCGGDSMYNELSIVKLDQPNNAYNHTELALPTTATAGSEASSPTFGVPSLMSSRRQRRGEMKAVVNVATSPHDSGHALLELDDGTLVQYSAGVTESQRLPTVKFATPESTGIPALPAEFWSRSLCLENIAGVVITASSFYNPNTNKGKIAIRAIEGFDNLKLKSRTNSVNSNVQQESTKNIPQSPIAADSEALQHAMQAPPASLSKKKKAKKCKDEGTRCHPPSTLAEKSESDPLCVTVVHVSPDKDPMMTPIRSLGSSTQATSAFTGGGPKVVSELFQPKTQKPLSESTVVAQSIGKATKKRKENMELFQPKNQKPLFESTIVAQSIEKATKKRKEDMELFQTKNQKPFFESTIVAQSIEKATKKRKEDMELFQPKTKKPLSESTIVAQSIEKSTKKRKEDIQYEMINADEKRLTKVAKVMQPQVDRLKLLKQEYQAKKSKTKMTGVPEQDQETAFFVSTTATIPIIKTSKATLEMRKNRPTDQGLSDVDTALLLANMKSPFKGLHNDYSAKSVHHDGQTTSPSTETTVAAASAQDALQKLKTPKPSISKASKYLSPKPSTQNQATREAFMRDKVAAQYSQLRNLLQKLTAKSAMQFQNRNMMGPTLTLTLTDKLTPREKYDKLMEEHRAAHDSLQKRLLRSAETTLRLLLDDDISADEARADLKASIKRFEEILYDILYRQQLERDAFLAQHRSLRETDEASTPSSDLYPCQPAFAKVEEICAAITRPVGRPKAIVSPAGP